MEILLWIQSCVILTTSGLHLMVVTMGRLIKILGNMAMDLRIIPVSGNFIIEVFFTAYFAFIAIRMVLEGRHKK